MKERFLRYSLENGRKICAVLLLNGTVIRKNMRVTAIDADGQGFTAMLPGKKKEAHVALADVLTCAYARGDQGELEQL